MFLVISKRNKIARWNGQRYQYDVGRHTQMMFDDTPLVISEAMFQRSMERFAKQMRGKYRDGVISLPYSPWKLHCHYLKWGEKDGVPHVGWMVYPDKLRNKSSLYKFYKCPLQESKSSWKDFLNWMSTVTEVVKKAQDQKLWN